MPAKKKNEAVEETAIEKITNSKENLSENTLLINEGGLLEITGADTEKPIATVEPEKKKRTPRKKKIDAETIATEDISSVAKVNSNPVAKPKRTRVRTADILTIESGGEVETEQSREDTAWHEIHNAYHTRKILSGTLDGIEQTEDGKSIIIVHYNGFRVLIPVKEMMLNIGDAKSHEYGDMMRRYNKILGNMLGAEIDFIIKGIDSKARSIVASRRDAILKKRQMFYLTPDDIENLRIHEGRIVQARVIAVTERSIRVEVFGVECSISSQGLSWEWMNDAHELYSVGDEILVRVLTIAINNIEDITITADVRSITNDNSEENLKKCRLQGKYAGQIINIHKGVVFIRLSNGANAIAHSCLDRKTPGKKDDISFVVTHIDNNRHVAVGIITRIIRQNI